MSFLGFQHEANSVSVYTDTLAMTDDQRPLAFVDKSFILQNPSVVVAVTGTMQLFDRWKVYLVGMNRATNVDELDEVTSGQLRGLWEEIGIRFKKKFGREVGETATIYQFGWSAKNNRFAAFAYRSTNNFASELLQPGTAVKPEPADPKTFRWPTTGEEFIEAAEQIRAEQNARPVGERLYIGGELIVTQVMRFENGMQSIVSAKIHRFDDYDDNLRVIKSLDDNVRAGFLPQPFDN
jgi:hypothetical protein